MTATSDYIYRGVSQSRGGPAAQADVHIRSERGWFAGLWTSTFDPPRGKVPTYEVDLYAGGAWEIARGWAASVSYQRYMYPNSRVPGQYDFGEMQASARFEDRVALTASYSPNAVRYSRYGWSTRGPQLAYELSLRQPAIGPVAIVAGAGYYDTKALLEESYWACSAGLSAAAGPLELTVARFATDSTARYLFGRFAANQWAVIATVRF